MNIAIEALGYTQLTSGVLKYSMFLQAVFCMKKIEVGVGDKYGRLSVLKEVESSTRDRKFLCSCECGSLDKTYLLAGLRSGRSKSCGCLRSEMTSERSRTHGMDGTRLYRVWCSMKERCNNPNCKPFKNYGARGITVCDEWLSFEPFRDWVFANGNGHAQGLHLDRIDNDAGYGPSNCRFVTQAENNRNKRITTIISRL